MKFTSLSVASVLLSSTNAWWGTGHLLVARIANDILLEESPTTLNKAESVLAILEKSDPSLTKDEGKHPFVECTTFADDIKGKGGSYQAGWHFIDTPFLDEGGKISDFDFKPDSHNVTEALTALTNWVNKEGSYQDSYEYQQVTSHGASGHTPADDVSYALRLIIHYTGDVHQPLHGTARVDKEYPAGDRGGNSFHLPNKLSASNLHAAWDSVLYEFTGYGKLPFTDSTWAENGEHAKTLMTKYPKDTLGDVTTMSPTFWANESFEIAENFVYKTISHHENEALPAEYIEEGNTLAEKQIVKAGYRLANLMKSLNFAQEMPVEELFLQA